MKICSLNISTESAAIKFYSHADTDIPGQRLKPDETCCDWWGCDLLSHNRVPVAVATEPLNKENSKCFNAVNSILLAYYFVAYIKPPSPGLWVLPNVFGGEWVPNLETWTVF